MKISNERLREFNENNAAAPVSYDRQQFFKANVAALDRLAKLEAAVEFKGFDELPEEGSRIECKHPDLVLPKREVYEACNYSLFDWLQKKGFTGWRYPVGDLSK